MFSVCKIFSIFNSFYKNKLKFDLKTFECQFKNELWFQGMWTKRPGALASVEQTKTVKLWEWLWHAVITGQGSLTRWPALLSVSATVSAPRTHSELTSQCILSLILCARLSLFFFCWVSSLVKKQELHLLESSPSELLHGLCPVLAAWNAPQEAAGREDTLIYFAWIRAKKHFSKAVQVIRSQLITKSSKNREKSIGNTNELQLSCICLQKSSF